MYCVDFKLAFLVLFLFFRNRKVVNYSQFNESDAGKGGVHLCPGGLHL